ncbi:MAG: THUMP domain-containing protein, partial [Candidatus Methanomethylicaceae archaeon]
MGMVIITVPSNKEERAKIEILDCIFPKDYEAKFIEHKYPGLLILESKKLSSDEILKLLEECPTAYIYKIIPVDDIVESNLNSIIKKIEELLKNKKGKIKVDCKKRGSIIKSSHEVEI